MADEIFVVLEGRGLFRYGDQVYPIRAYYEGQTQPTPLLARSRDEPA